MPTKLSMLSCFGWPCWKLQIKCCVTNDLFTGLQVLCNLHEPAGKLPELTGIMRPQRTSASKPALELQILCPCLLGNFAVFKTLIKPLFKLRRLWKYIGQSLFSIFIYSAITHSAAICFLPDFWSPACLDPVLDIFLLLLPNSSYQHTNTRTTWCKYS